MDGGVFAVRSVFWDLLSCVRDQWEFFPGAPKLFLGWEYGVV